MEELLKTYRLPISIYEHMQAESINYFQLLESEQIIKTIQKTLKPIQITKFNKLLEELNKQVNKDDEINEKNILLHSEINASVEELYSQYYVESWQLEKIIDLILENDKSRKIKTKLEQSKIYHQERAKRIFSLLQQKDQENVARIIKSHNKFSTIVNKLNDGFKHNERKINKRNHQEVYNLISINSKKVKFSEEQDIRRFHMLGLIIITLIILYYTITTTVNSIFKNQ